MNNPNYDRKSSADAKRQDQDPGNFICDMLENNCGYSQYGYPMEHGEKSWETTQAFVKQTGPGGSTFTARRKD